MKVQKYEQRVVLTGEEGDELEIYYDNRGEPYREGITLNLRVPRSSDFTHLFIRKDEALELRDLIDKLFGKPQPRTEPCHCEVEAEERGKKFLEQARRDEIARRGY